MTTLDPFDFDTYFLQRMSEFFGPDFESFMGFPQGPRTRPSPVTVRPEGGGWMEPAARGRYPHETPETEEITELETEKPSRRELRRAFRQYIPIDISESENGYLVEANLPGVPKESIQIHVDHNNVLTIDAKATPSVAHACGFMGKIASESHGGSVSSTSTSAGGGRGEEAGKPRTTGPETSAGRATSGTDIPTPQESPTKEKTSAGGAETAATREESQMRGMEETRKFMLSERQKGRLHRSIRLPKFADPDKVKSCMENGVLCLFFEKIPAAAAAKRIELH